MTRDITFTVDERKLLLKWADNEWANADERRMLAPPDSKREAAHLAEQKAIEIIQGKLR